VFAILILEEHEDLPHQDLLLTTAIITIGLSVLAHGVTAAPLADRYSAWFRRDPRTEDERKPAQNSSSRTKLE
jgi:NhaP-type Na+/H+ or K+/H+ antiporter